MNLVRLFKSSPDDRVEPAHAAPRQPAERAALPPQIEPLIGQLEDDMRFTMRIIGYEADKARAKIEESVAHVARIGAASESLSTLSGSAHTASKALLDSAHRLEAATEAIRRDVSGADAFIAEAHLLTGEVGSSMARLTDAIGRIDSVMHIMGAIARHTNILALNAGIEAARAGPEGRSFGVLAGEVKSLATKAQKATVDITNQVASLHAVAKQNRATVAKIARLMRRINPVVSSIQRSVEAQTRETQESAARAGESAHFVEAVARSANEAKRLADIANVASIQAQKAGDGVVYAMNRYAQRSTVYLRNSVSGNRRKFERIPVKLPASVIVNGIQTPAVVLDISEGGALLAALAPDLKVGVRSRLSLHGIGDCAGVITGVSDLGHHFTYEDPAPDVLERIRRVIAAVKQSDEPFAKATQTGAGEIARAFENGVAFGEISIDDLITTDYRPIADTDPVQYETGALAFYERVLPSIMMKFWEASPEPVFVLATDRNAYIPVHHPRYSMPQQPNQWLWNDLNSRNKRIMERWQMLVISRNTEPCYRKVFLRQMKDAAYVPIKVFASPIFIRGRLWGNFQLGYHY